MSSQNYNPKTGKARIFFRFGGRQFNRTIKVNSERAGLALCETVDQTISDLERGRLALPPDSDPVSFILSGGKVVESQADNTPSKPVTLAEVFERYQAEPPPHLEASTRRMQDIHFKRLREALGAKSISAFSRATAQDYVSHRAKQQFRGKTIQAETISKELKTLRSAWAWIALRSGDIPPPTFALKDLSFPKEREAPLHDMEPD